MPCSSVDLLLQCREVELGLEWLFKDLAGYIDV